MAWRDGMAQRTGAFNRTLPTLSAILQRAELLGYRARGTNPCKGIARYKRPKKERFLSLRDYNASATFCASLRGSDRSRSRAFGC